MASAHRSGDYDWKQPPEPPAFARWIADHRLLVRIALIALDIALAVFTIAGSFSGDTRWYNYLNLIVYAGITWQAGWSTPKSVDNWRTARRARPSNDQE